MMFISIDTIIRETLKQADENITALPIVPESANASSTADFIESLITEVARHLIDTAPLSLLDESLPLEVPERYNRNLLGEGELRLPDDFRRLRMFKMTDWRRPVEEAVETTHPRYMLQQSRHAGLQASPERPLCLLVHSDGFKVLRHYGSTSYESEIETARYIPDPVADSLHRIWIPAALAPKLIEKLAIIVKDGVIG